MAVEPSRPDWGLAFSRLEAARGQRKERSMRRPIPKGLPVLSSVIVAGLCGLGAYTLQDCARPRKKNAPTRRTLDPPIPGNPPISAAVVASGLCFVGGQFGTDADNRP